MSSRDWANTPELEKLAVKAEANGASIWTLSTERRTRTFLEEKELIFEGTIVNGSVCLTMPHRFNIFPVGGPVGPDGRPLGCCDCGKWSDTSDPAPCTAHELINGNAFLCF